MAAWFSRRRASVPLPQLRLDPVACDGVGICAHLAPEVITVDMWGYPIVGDVGHGRARRQAEAAVAGCPKRALFLTDVGPAPAPGPTRAGTPRG